MSNLTTLREKLINVGWAEVVRVEHLGPCWEWNGGKFEKRGGYGQIRWEGKPQAAHRLAYRAWIGAIPTSQNICHHCDNPPCIRPVHLFPGSDLDNALDKVAKGRSVYPSYCSQDAPAAKPTSDEVIQIKELLAQGVSLTELGKRFHVTKQAIWRIKEGLTWTVEKMTR